MTNINLELVIIVVRPFSFDRQTSSVNSKSQYCVKVVLRWDTGHSQRFMRIEQQTTCVTVFLTDGERASYIPPRKTVTPADVGTTEAFRVRPLFRTE